MGPKKDKKAKGKGKVTGIVIDGVDTREMTREQLEAFALRIKEENEREREERNFFQLERDKLRTFWEITKNELEEARAKLRNKDRQIEEAAEKNDDELKFYKQKVKHLQYEHQNNLTESKADALVSLKMAQDDHIAQERELLTDKKILKNQIREIEFAHQDQIKCLKLAQSEEISEMRVSFEEKYKEVETKYDQKFKDLQSDLSIKHNIEMSEIEERKNTQISELIKHHDHTYTEIKNYYNDITLNNLALISSLKDQMEILRKHNERMSKQVADVLADNRRLAEPLKKAQEDVTEYKRLLANYDKDKLALSNTKAKYYSTKKELDDLRWQNDALELRFEKLQVERDELSKRFADAVLEVQQKSGLKNILLQKRVEVLTEKADYREALIEELTYAGKTLPPGGNKRLEDIISKKNETISDLQYELARIAKAHDDLLFTYEEKLQEYGIPKTELGFIPLRELPEGYAKYARGPAGVVTKNQ